MRYHKEFLSILFVLVLGSTACNLTGQAPAGITVPTPVEPPALAMPDAPTTQAVIEPTIEPVVIAPTTEPVTITSQMDAVFVANNSGSLCPKRSPDLIVGGPPPIVGEIDDEWRCEGYWSFDISGLPARATILSAAFQPGNCTITGNPFSLDNLYIGFIDVGTLEVSDYGGPPQQPTAHTSCPSTIDIVSLVKTSINRNSQVLQLFAAFDNSNYGNGTGDYISYQGSVPSLTIEYSYLTEK